MLPDPERGEWKLELCVQAERARLRLKIWRNKYKSSPEILSWELYLLYVEHERALLNILHPWRCSKLFKSMAVQKIILKTNQIRRKKNQSQDQDHSTILSWFSCCRNRGCTSIRSPLRLCQFHEVQRWMLFQCKHWVPHVQTNAFGAIIDYNEDQLNHWD